MTTIFMSLPLDFDTTLTHHDDDNDNDNDDDQDHSTADQSALSFLGFDLRDLDEDDAILRGLDVPIFNFLEESHDQTSAGVDALLGTHCHLQPLTSCDTKPQSVRKRRRRKRTRRPCTVVGCLNRVVQGGVCVAHGARRKACKFPGCDKSVKKAGFCSTHGPARKRCEVSGCARVAVQGGICIGHGAKKIICQVEGCRKQGLNDGLCNDHSDQTQAAEQGSIPILATPHATDPFHEIPTLPFPPPTNSPAPIVNTPSAGMPTPSFHVRPQCYEIPSLAVAVAVAEAPAPSRAFQQTMYSRGLSIFEEIGLHVGSPMPPPPPLVPPQSTSHERISEPVLQGLYDEAQYIQKYESV